MSDKSFAKIRFQTQEFSESQQVDWSLTRNMVPKVKKKNGEHMLTVCEIGWFYGGKKKKRTMHNITQYLARHYFMSSNFHLSIIPNIKCYS